MGEPKRYGLIIPAKKNTRKPMISKPAVFGDDSSDDEERAHKEVNLSLIQESQKKKQMKQTQIEIQKALKEDPTVYEYDAVYDEMEEKKKAANVKVPEKNKKPKYIGSLLKAAAARKREFERTVERQVQKEREKEKGEFDDKEAFVTEAFRQKMQEQLEEEERIKHQDAIDAANDVTKQKDLSLFYRNLLNKNVSLGGSFTANDTTKTDLPNFENDKEESQGKDEREPPVMSENRKQGKYRDKNESEYSREQEVEENQTHSRVPSQHMRNHDHNCKQRDSESYKDQRSTDLSNLKRRRGSDREHETFATHRHSRGFKPHQLSHDDRQNNDHSKYSQDDSKAPDKDKNKIKKITKESKETLKDEFNKFAKRSTGETVSSAKERYLARKQARSSAKSATANDDSD